MASDDLHHELDDLIRAIGQKETQKFLRSKLEASLAKSRTLTIVCDETMHQIPERLIVGDKYLFSTSPLELDSSEIVQSQLEERIRKLAALLLARKYNRYRIVYSGHAILGSIVKHTVYRITHKEAEDIIYFGNGGYFTLKFNIRSLLSKAPTD